MSSAMAFKGADPPYYHKLMGKAVELYGAAVKHKGRYSGKSIYKCAPEVRTNPIHPASAPQTVNVSHAHTACGIAVTCMRLFWYLHPLLPDLAVVS